MKKIILANIGNSHIRYIGTAPEVQLKGDRNVPFRESTRYLLEHFDEEGPNIIPEILPPLIESEIAALTKIIMFVTDSPSGERNNQDTVYEGEILKRIFREKYSNVEVQIIPVLIKVTDINALMKFYRNIVNDLLKEHLDDKFILVDAGGTSQQKSSLKIILEYLLDTEQLEAYNIKFDKGKSIPERIASDEYRRVLNQQQMGRLIQQYDYMGALTISGINWRRVTTPVSDLLLIAHALFSNNVVDGRRRAQSFPKSLGFKDLVSPIGNGNIYKEAAEEFKDLLDDQIVFALYNVLNIAKAHHKIGNWGFVVLFYHIFLERFLEAVIEPEIKPLKRSDWQKVKEQILQGQLFSGIEYLGDRTVKETFSFSLPVLISLARHLKNDKINTVLDCLSSDHQKNFSALRNKFAHEGRTISEKEIKFLYPVFELWQSKFLRQNENLFDKLNERIIKELKN